MITKSNSIFYTIILGIGKTGFYSAYLYNTYGIFLKILDTRNIICKLKTIKHILSNDTKYFIGNNIFNSIILKNAIKIVLSPGLSINKYPINRILDLAKINNIEIISEIEIFSRLLYDLNKNGYKPIILAVTGTNGKTTVTKIIFYMMKYSKKIVSIAGNVNPATLLVLIKCMKKNFFPEIFVIELSSFQLKYTKSILPFASTILNLNKDHIDWHKIELDYIKSKKRIYRNSRNILFNQDDKNLKKNFFNVKNSKIKKFSKDINEYLSDIGLLKEQKKKFIAITKNNKIKILSLNSQKYEKKYYSNLLKLKKIKLVMSINDIHINEKHNVINILASIALSNIKIKKIDFLIRSVSDYSGELYRLNFTNIIENIFFINDSKSTNIGSMKAAIDSIENKKLILILGGNSKNQKFNILFKSFKKKIFAVIIIGYDSKKIFKDLKKTELLFMYAYSVDDAINIAYSLSKFHYSVLFSPSCSSHDMFKNYIHRGKKFEEEIKYLLINYGEIK